MNQWIEPFSDNEMTYNLEEHRYVLDPNYVRSRGIDLGLVLNTEVSPIPEQAESIFLDRVSQMVYDYIYEYGRTQEIKEFLLACDPTKRKPIRDAMLERVLYIIDNGDLSTKSGINIQQGLRVETKDLVASSRETQILRKTGILHRGEYHIVIDSNLVY